MQERINKRRLVLLATLVLATLLVFWWVQPENRLSVNEDVFRVANFDQINKVSLASANAEVNLEYNGGRWRVNDEFNADGDMIRVLFATLQQARPKRPVAHALRDSIFSSLAASGVKVSLYEGEALKKEFYAGGNAGKTQAMFADPATGDVFVMTIPGYRVYVSGILELGINGWRDKFVFGFNWRNFKTLEARFPGKPAGNFTVAMQKAFFGIEGMPQVDTARLNTFLDDVSLLTVEAYLSEPELSDSLARVAPEMEIVISDVAGRAYNLRLFEPGNAKEVYGLIQGSQPALFQRRKIQALLKPKSFFQKK